MPPCAGIGEPQTRRTGCQRRDPILGTGAALIIKLGCTDCPGRPGPPGAARRRALAAVAALAFAALIGGCGNGAAGSDRAVTFGFNDDPNPRWFASQAELGMPARRLPVPWSEVEPERGRWNWKRADASYAAMRAAGLRPLIVAIGAPCWARAPAPACSPASAGIPAPASDAEWADYAARLAARYPDALGIEVWNEPNLTALFPPAPDPQRFAALLGAAYAAVKRVDPALPVVLGGLLSIASTGPRGMADADFLAAVYAAGAGASMDAIGAHPYPPAEALAAGASAAGEVEAALARLRSPR